MSIGEESLPQCVICMKTLSNSAVKPSLLKLHLVTNHVEEKERELLTATWRECKKTTPRQEWRDLPKKEGCCQSILFVLFYLPFLSSIHEKANCIAILWMGSPHSLGSCLFRGLWATCLPHKDGGIPLSALPKDTTSELAGLFSTTSHKCRAPSREAIDTIFVSLLV